MSARHRRLTSRRTTGGETTPQEPKRTPEEPVAPVYDPAEALEVFDQSAEAGSSPHATEALFDVSALDETPQGEWAGRDETPQSESEDLDEEPRLEPADLDEKTGEPRGLTRRAKRERRGLFAGLFSRKPKPAVAADAADAEVAETTEVPEAAEAADAAGTVEVAEAAEAVEAVGVAEVAGAARIVEVADAAEVAEVASAAVVAEVATAAEPEAAPAVVPAPLDAPEADAAAAAPGERDVAEADASDAIDASDEDETRGRWVRPVRRRRAGRAHRQQPALAEAVPEKRASGDRPSALSRTRTLLTRGAKTTLGVVLIIVVLMGALYGLVVGVNAFARWNALRLAEAATSTATGANNLLVIGVRDGVAVGFTALKAERSNGRVLGIAIPEGAFVEVPGQGFERIGSSYTSGPGVSMDTVSNYLGVPFRRYIVVGNTAYQALLRNQNIAGLMKNVTATDLTTAERTSYTSYFSSVQTKNVWIASLPVKAITVGDQQYYEPQRSQVADLLLQWWGVKVSDQNSASRVIVYNGVGTPGLAGLASQQLIKAGFRIVNSGNAPNFNYKHTQILLYHGTQADAASVRATLGVGQIKVESAQQDLTDMIVIIGADYSPPVTDAATSTVSTTEGAK